MDRRSKGIKVTLRDVERMCISLMKENNKPHILNKMDRSTPGIYYTIGSDVWRSQNGLWIDWETRQNNGAPGSCVGSQTIGLWLG